MAFDISRIGAGRSGESTKDGHHKYVVVWQGITNNPHDGPAEFVAELYAMGVRLFTPYTGYEASIDNQFALLISLNPEQDGDAWQKWRCRGTFSTNWLEKGNDTSQSSSPDEDPSLFWIETEFGTRKTTQTWDGEDIVTAAGQAHPDIEKPTARETWIWEKNYLTLDRENWKAFQCTVNSEPVEEIDPYQGLLRINVSKPQYRGGVLFYKVQFRVEVNTDEEGWRVNPANRGTVVLNKPIESGGKQTRPVDQEGKPMDGEVWLKTDGTQERDPDPPVRWYTGPWDVLEPKDFNELGFLD